MTAVAAFPAYPTDQIRTTATPLVTPVPQKLHTHADFSAAAQALLKSPDSHLRKFIQSRNFSDGFHTIPLPPASAFSAVAPKNLPKLHEHRGAGSSILPDPEALAKAVVATDPAVFSRASSPAPTAAAANLPDIGEAPVPAAALTITIHPPGQHHGGADSQPVTYRSDAPSTARAANYAAGPTSPTVAGSPTVAPSAHRTLRGAFTFPAPPQPPEKSCCKKFLESCSIM